MLYLENYCFIDFHLKKLLIPQMSVEFMENLYFLVRQWMKKRSKWIECAHRERFHFLSTHTNTHVNYHMRHYTYTQYSRVSICIRAWHEECAKEIDSVGVIVWCTDTKYTKRRAMVDVPVCTHNICNVSTYIYIYI